MYVILADYFKDLIHICKLEIAENNGVFHGDEKKPDLVNGLE